MLISRKIPNNFNDKLAGKDRLTDSVDFDS